MQTSRKFVAALISVVFLGSVFLALGPVMRESDQASLVDGALIIARDGEWVGQSYYNYSRQYVSYWVTAAAIGGRVDTAAPADIDALVDAGNRVAAAVLALGLAVAVWRRRGKWSRCELAVLALALFCPVMWLSAPLLSSNIIAAGFVLVLVSVLARRRSPARTLVAAAATFLAVGARSDVALILPLIVLLSAPSTKVRGVTRDACVWSMGVAAVLALAVGRMIEASPAGMPETFFDLRLFAAYSVFGLNGLLPVLVIFTGGSVVQAVRARSWWLMAVAFACVVPWLFYGPLLYSPRHLIVVVVGCLATILLPRGRSLWQQLMRARLARAGVVLGVVMSCGMMVFGLRIDSARSISPQVWNSTFYPTADGLWPMGANVSFFERLADADSRPIDHNQLVWYAWCAVDQPPIENADIPVYSSGLGTYGLLRLRALGGAPVLQKSFAQPVAFDSRSFLRRKVDRAQLGGAGGSIHNQSSVAELRAMQRIGSGFGAEIYWWGDNERAPECGAATPLEIRALIATLTPNDRMTLGRASDPWEDLAHAGTFEWIVVLPEWQPEMTSCGGVQVEWGGYAWTVIQTTGDAGWITKVSDDLPGDAWVARSTMVNAFQLNAAE